MNQGPCRESYRFGSHGIVGEDASEGQGIRPIQTAVTRDGNVVVRGQSLKSLVRVNRGGAHRVGRPVQLEHIEIAVERHLAIERSRVGDVQDVYVGNIGHEKILVRDVVDEGVVGRRKRKIR